MLATLEAFATLEYLRYVELPTLLAMQKKQKKTYLRLLVTLTQPLFLATF